MRDSDQAAMLVQQTGYEEVSDAVEFDMADLPADGDPYCDECEHEVFAAVTCWETLDASGHTVRVCDAHLHDTLLDPTYSDPALIEVLVYRR